MMKKGTSHIGVFDSGFGGITILKEITKRMPQYSYLYLGDTARTPYGTRSQAIIYEFTKQAIDFLFKQGCTLIIVACNTASSEALRKLQREYLPKKYPGRKILGVLIPAAEISVEKSHSKRIGVLATEGTVQSEAFVKEIKKLNAKALVFQQSAPLLVTVVESGEQRLPATRIILEQYLRPLQKKKIDTLILGCTHYSVLETTIKTLLGKEITVISEGKIVAQKLEEYLKKHREVETHLSRKSNVTFFSTDLTQKFSTLGIVFFGKQITVKKVTLL